MPYATARITAALAGVLTATAPAVAGYRAPALVRVRHAGAGPAAMHAVVAAEGTVITRDRDWFEAVVPADRVAGGAGALGLGPAATLEVLDPDLDAQLRALGDRPDAGVYHTPAEVEAELTALAAARPDLISTEVIGTSVEGRPILAARVSSKPPGAAVPTFLVCGMHHAREWISVEVPMALVHDLVGGYDRDPATRSLVDSREIWVVPVLNPDGLEYSQTEKRMWRKNRRPNPDGSVGVDLNRNWGYQWGKLGASPNPKSDTFRGPGPFSEPELVALRGLARRERPVGAVSYHSYGELVLWPWGYDHDRAPDEGEMIGFAREMARLSGYRAMQSAGLYPASGDFDDWFYGELGARSFTVELGKKFVPPEAEVPGIIARNLPALKYFLREAATPLPALSHTPPFATTDPAGPYPVAFRRSPRYAPAEITGATLRYRVGAGDPAALALTRDADGGFTGAIPGGGHGAVRYHVEVTLATGGTRRLPPEGSFGFEVVEALHVLVDDDGGKAFERPYQEALEALGVPYTMRGSDGFTDAELLGATAVVWSCGDAAGGGLTVPERARLVAYLEAGGELLLFGQDLAYAIGSSPLMRDYLRVEFKKDSVSRRPLRGAPAGFLAGLELTIDGREGIRQRFPDGVLPRAGAAGVLTYVGAPEDAGVAVAAGYKAAYFGFGLEGVDGPENRRAVLGRGLAWLGEGGAGRRLRRAARLRRLGADPEAATRLEAGVLDQARRRVADGGDVSGWVPHARGPLAAHLRRLAGPGGR